MATLLNLAQSGEVIKVDPVLGLRELELRRIYLLPRAHKWLVEVLPETDSDRNIEETPSEQLDALFYEFCSGQALPVGRTFKALVHLGDGVWELKTADVRLFGWFTQRDCFVVSDCDSKYNLIQRRSMYRGYCEQAVRLRDNLALDEPKFVTGDNPDDVISDCY
ncbi:hypothetical protein [Sphingorhabdus sp.]|jgi:hypothetical protein|uniref:hypothetical protein n=1 Tax=Sphingorhabdus sp. TaxID=1902408 RepID=UPI003D81AF87